MKKTLLINSQKCQTGMSLIEILIAMVIGLFLLSGIATSYISSHKSNVKQDELSKLEDSGRLALDVLSRAIEHTGYTPVHAGIIDPPFITDSTQVISETCPSGEDSVVNKALFTATKVTKDYINGDRISVAYNGDQRVNRDCSGRELPDSCKVDPPSVPATGASSNRSKIYNAFFIKKNTVIVDSIKRTQYRLMCAGSRDKSIQTISDGIENMQFMYGLSTLGGDVDRYVKAADVDAWNNVVSVQIAILVRSEKPVKPKKEQITYTLLDQKYTAAKDRHQRAVFTTTVRLRNTL